MVITQQFIRRIRQSFLVTLALALCLSASQAFSESPRGVYSIPNKGKKISDTVLANPNVDGIALRQNWSDIEKTDGVYDWSYFDAEIARAAGVGKKVLLRVMTMGGRPAWIDTAIRNKGGKFFTWKNNGVNTTIPVFWDPTFLSKKTAMITAMGAHFTNNPSVVIVVASFANAASEDWNVPHTSDLITQWFSLGYTSDKLIDAGKQIINATMTAFPNQFVTLAIGGNGHSGSTGNLDPESDYVARAVVDQERSVWPGRLIVQKNDLSTCIPVTPGGDSLYAMIWDYQPDVAGQMLDVIFNKSGYKVSCGVPADPVVTLQTAIDLALGYGEKRIEIYQSDVVNYPTAIAYAHTRLLAQP